MPARWRVERLRPICSSAAGSDYLTDLGEWQNVQSGVSTPTTTAGNMFDPKRRYLFNGRALGAFTHVDELYQAYLAAYLVLNTLGIGRRQKPIWS
jgi:hypothetical protein